MKTYIRTLWGNDLKPLWYNETQRESLRHYLNECGFYAITGVGDSLEVSVIDYPEPWDIILFHKALDKIHKSWYNLNRRNKGGTLQ